MTETPNDEEQERVEDAEYRDDGDSEASKADPEEMERLEHDTAEDSAEDKSE